MDKTKERDQRKNDGNKKGKEHFHGEDTEDEEGEPIFEEACHQREKYRWMIIIHKLFGW